MTGSGVTDGDVTGAGSTDAAAARRGRAGHVGAGRGRAGGPTVALDEARMLDSGGRMDVPAVLPEDVERVLIADHQWPGTEGPITPSALRELIAAGKRTAEDAVSGLVTAMYAE
jgi:hypothetical protein